MQHSQEPKPIVVFNNLEEPLDSMCLELVNVVCERLLSLSLYTYERLGDS
jgi:hypothetical protein